jgi:hypothetical protein
VVDEALLIGLKGILNGRRHLVSQLVDATKQQ